MPMMEPCFDYSDDQNDEEVQLSLNSFKIILEISFVQV